MEIKCNYHPDLKNKKQKKQHMGHNILEHNIFFYMNFSMGYMPFGLYKPVPINPDNITIREKLGCLV